MNDDSILSVSALTHKLKGAIETSFPFVWVRGQATNVSRPSSGHVYFSLRDEDASLAAVWFKGAQKPSERFDPLTGEVYEGGPRPSLAESLANGQEIICAGRLTVYAPRGAYQLIVELAQDAGLGRLHAEFERLREKLAGLGYFAGERKRPLPEHPRRVAVVTAPAGAAIYDFLRIAENRGLGAEVRIYPVPVQGDAAPPLIHEAVRRINGEGWAEVIVLIRGGGSLEDLWAFNTENVAGAVFGSAIPVLAGIGHEIDITLADMTADLRAATPSHAAQLLWPDRAALFASLENLTRELGRVNGRLREERETALRALERSLHWHSPGKVLENWTERLTGSLERLSGASARLLERARMRLLQCESAFPRLPEQIFAPAVHTLERMEALLGQAPARLPAKEASLAALDRQLRHSGELLLAQAGHGLERMDLRLSALDPHAPLERGYALARKADGRYVRAKDQVRAGELLNIVVADGEFPARVEGEA